MDVIDVLEAFMAKTAMEHHRKLESSYRAIRDAFFSDPVRVRVWLA